jgi:23S rRNA (guanosine2251-2'-O)-methyltransferase
VVLIYGFHPVREALRHRPHLVARVLIARRRSGQRRQTIESLCRRHRIRVEIVEEEQLSRLAAGVHNGFVAESAAAPAGKDAGPAGHDLIVLLEDVQDPRNLGAILRVCEGAGVGKVLVRDRGSAPISPAVVKAAAGASEWLAVERIPNTAAAVARLQKAGYWVYGADPAGTAPWELDLRGKIVLCLGGEAKGLRARTRKICDGLVGLPMLGRVESLNVSAAAAALVYEAVRQRQVEKT